MHEVILTAMYILIFFIAMCMGILIGTKER